MARVEVVHVTQFCGFAFSVADFGLAPLAMTRDGVWGTRAGHLLLVRGSGSEVASAAPL
jgi:hypothetical protein